ncbi:MAG: hypothetical protein OXT70_01080 [Chloroflexota bacterium]|nr:hypothetical protein [Chloroflexota bacterium]
MTGRTYTDRTGNIVSEVELVKQILSSYDTKITIRRLFYIMVDAGLLAKKESEYKSLAQRLSRYRKTGQLSLTAFADLSTSSYGLTGGWASPRAMLDDFDYRSDWWADADVRPQLWCEGVGTVTVLEPVARRWCVKLVPCGGKPSITMRAEAAEEALADEEIDAPGTMIGYFGDFDPSGLVISENLALTLREWSEGAMAVQRIGLNEHQTAGLTSAGRPPKPTDTATPAFVERYGNDTWELEAVPVDTLRQWAEEWIQQWATFDPDEKRAEDAERWAEFLENCDD